MLDSRLVALEKRAHLSVAVMLLRITILNVLIVIKRTLIPVLIWKECKENIIMTISVQFSLLQEQSYLMFTKMRQHRFTGNVRVHWPSAIDTDQFQCVCQKCSHGCLITKCVDFDLYYECSNKCTLGKKCVNSRIIHFSWKELIVCDSGIRKDLMVLNKNL